jgi:hypothetical protein
MKKIYSIIFFIFLFSPLVFGADANAIQSEGTELIHSPDWEREADARIWSDRVIEDFKSGSSKGFKINALCDETALIEIKKFRKLSLEIIEKDLFSQNSTSLGTLALKIYRTAENYLPVADADEAGGVIARFELLPQKERRENNSGFSGSSIPEGPSLLCASFTGVTVNTGNPELKRGNAASGRVKPDYTVHKSGLKLGALWDREETDYYRIFLYIRDTDRIKKLLSNIIFPPLHFSLSLKSYFFTPQITTENHSITEPYSTRVNIFYKFSLSGVLRFIKETSFISKYESEKPLLCNYHDRPIFHFGRIHVINKPISINSQGAVL